MTPVGEGYFELVTREARSGTLYYYCLDGQRDLPDPASRFQPEGIPGPSCVVPVFESKSHPASVEYRDLVLYEVHIGTISAEGTFDAAARCLDHVCRLGATAIELMPITQFPGKRNWGYDVDFPFAVQNTYGGPEGLRRFVDASHDRGLCVVLDLVYNHFGPGTEFFQEYGSYFGADTDWGPSPNFANGAVVEYYVQNAEYWVRRLGVDELRLDAQHAIPKPQPRTLLSQIDRRIGEEAVLMAESDDNDPEFILPSNEALARLDAQWNEDFHHAIHALLTGERNGYYRDIGEVAHLAKAYRDGFVLTGQYSRYRRGNHGRSSADAEPEILIVYAQNHDRVGNRPDGRRLGDLVGSDKHRLAAAAVLLSPSIPLLFMGEECVESSPFFFFSGQADPLVANSTRQGRRQFLSSLGWRAEAPDPQIASTRDRSCVTRKCDEKLFRYYQKLLELRRRMGSERSLSVVEYPQMIIFDRGAFRIILHFGDDSYQRPEGKWRILLDSADREWGGPGSASSDGTRLSPWSAAVFCRNP